MKKLIRKILREHKSDRHYKILDKITEHVQLPYFESMEGLTIYDKGDQLYIMKKIFGNDIRINEWGDIRDENDEIIYYEDTDGFWEKSEYDKYGNQRIFEYSDGWWEKYEYDDNGNEIYYEDYNGDWWKREYDEDGNEIDYDEGDNR